MLRTILTAVGIVELLSPEALIDAAERIALDDPDDCELKPWVVPGARIEGLAFLILMWRSDASYSAFKKFLGLVGILALAFPRAYVDYGAELAYTDAAECEWKPWVYPGTRLVGLLYVGIALDELRKGRASGNS
ncbi:hypothetical protein ACFQPA_12980 [Halomarina halobia]|uniref:Uncharacterized protein n=1 Tax=Halomarina halobia TaxID=3033386 RepID=A0ABD6A9I3_9EURY|nr:hypothetical protein [Halomarina sp. PSR21]